MRPYVRRFFTPRLNRTKQLVGGSEERAASVFKSEAKA